MAKLNRGGGRGEPPIKAKYGRESKGGGCRGGLGDRGPEDSTVVGGGGASRDGSEKKLKKGKGGGGEETTSLKIGHFARVLERGKKVTRINQGGRGRVFLGTGQPGLPRVGVGAGESSQWGAAPTDILGRVGDFLVGNRGKKEKGEARKKK